MTSFSFTSLWTSIQDFSICFDPRIFSAKENPWIKMSCKALLTHYLCELPLTNYVLPACQVYWYHHPEDCNWESMVVCRCSCMYVCVCVCVHACRWDMHAWKQTSSMGDLLSRSYYAEWEHEAEKVWPDIIHLMKVGERGSDVVFEQRESRCIFVYSYVCAESPWTKVQKGNYSNVWRSSPTSIWWPASYYWFYLYWTMKCTIPR